MRAIAARVGATFNLDVMLNRDHQITSIFSGELFASHATSSRSVGSVTLITRGLMVAPAVKPGPA